MQGLARLGPDQRSDALRIYAKMDLDDLAQAPTSIIGASGYLILLSLCLLLMVSVYSQFVIPNLIGFHESAQAVVPPLSLAVSRASPLILWGVTLLGVYLLASAWALRRMAALRSVGAGPWSVPWLLPQGLRARHTRLLDLISSPAPELCSEPMQQRLRSWLAEGQSIEDELPGLVRAQSAELAQAARRFLGVLGGVLAVTAIACVVTFVLGMYLPFFHLGVPL